MIAPLALSWDVKHYVWCRGAGAGRRVVHIASFDRLGRFAGALCGIAIAFDTSCNLPLGRPVCERCRSIERGLLA